MSTRRRAGERYAGTTLLPVPGSPTPLDDPASPSMPLGSPRRPARPPRRAVQPLATVHRPVPGPRLAAPAPASAPGLRTVASPATVGWLLHLLVMMIGSFIALLDTS